MNEIPRIHVKPWCGAFSPATAHDFELIQTLPPGEYSVDPKPAKPRSVPMNGLYWSVLNKAVTRTHLQDSYPRPKKLHRGLLFGTGHTEIIRCAKTGRIVEQVDSTAFRAMEQPEFQLYFDAAMPLLSHLLGYDWAILRGEQ